MMVVLLAVDAGIRDALKFWLHSQGHNGFVLSTNQANCAHQEPKSAKLALDYAHLKPYLWGTTPIPTHWPEIEHWLLIDAYLDHSQLIAAIQFGCRHISIAPLQAEMLNAWLKGAAQVPNLTCEGLHSQAFAHSTLVPEPMLAAFVGLMITDQWTQQEQAQQVDIIKWRNVALQTPVFTQLKQELRLDPIGFAQLACHTLAGSQWLLSQGLDDAAMIASQHHEHWDGSGYPFGIKAEAICLAARLAKLYDSYVGLRKDKRYAKACDHATSINKLSHGDGYLSPSQFDPQLLKHFLSAQKAVEDLYNLHHRSID